MQPAPAVHPQYQALFLWLVLAAGWAWAGANRRAERLQRLQRLRPNAPRPTASIPAFPEADGDSAYDASAADCRTDTAVLACTATAGVACTAVRQGPAVSVVMPVKGCRAHSLDNWRSHVGVQYGGWGYA